MIFHGATIADVTEQKLDGFARLSPGWHYGGGVAVRPDRIARAKTFLSWYRLLGVCVKRMRFAARTAT